MDKPVPAPRNSVVEFLNRLLDTLIKGLGGEAAKAEVFAALPWLNIIIIRDVVSFFVDQMATAVDETVEKNADIVVIRFQGDIRKVDYDHEIAPIKAGNPTPEDIQKVKDAIDRIIRRSH